jgi:hypothetical protein
MTLKTCSHCKQVLPLSSFTSHAKNKDKLQGSCRECNKAKCIIWNSKNKNALALNRIKHRALEKGIAFDIELSDIAYPEKCPVFGFDLVRNYKVPCFNSPSVDRIDPSKGYIKGNIQVISQLANCMKQNASQEQLIQFAEWILKTYKKETNENSLHS